MYGIIYRYLDRVNGKVYVGQTTCALAVRKRLHKHRALTLKRDSPFYTALREHGPTAFSVDVLDHAASPGELDAKEIAWIARLQANDPDFGYNTTAGGRRAKPSAATVAKIRNRRRPPVITADLRRRIGEASRKQWQDPVYREKMSAIQKSTPNHPTRGRRLPAQHRKRIAEAIRVWHALRKLNAA